VWVLGFSKGEAFVQVGGGFGFVRGCNFQKMWMSRGWHRRFVRTGARSMKEGRRGNTRSTSILGLPPASSSESESDAGPNQEGCFAYAHTSANLLIDLLGPSEEDTTTNAVLPSIFVFGRDCECAARTLRVRQRGLNGCRWGGDEQAVTAAAGRRGIWSGWG
jgi:hypothetical protein